MLKIAMGHPRFTQLASELDPDRRQLVEEVETIEVSAEKGIERVALDPAHLDHGEPVAADANALFEILELHHEGAGVSFEVFADGLVAFVKSPDLTGKTLDCPGFLAVGCIHLVDDGEVARVGQRSAKEPARGGLALFQLRVLEADRGRLDRVVVVR
jgi:hypothetical protein